MNCTAGDIPSQSGRRVPITGGNSGIVFHAALELARRAAEIVLLARTHEKASYAVQRIQAEVPNAKLEPAILDLAHSRVYVPLPSSMTNAFQATRSISISTTPV